MTPRSVLGAWALALAVVLLAVLAGGLAPQPAAFHGARIAVIGSSQMRYAVPKAGGGADSLLGDGRSHFRIGVGAISEIEAETLLARAIDEHAELVLVDAAPLIYDLAWGHARGRCDQPLRPYRATIKQAQVRVTDTWARWAHLSTNRRDRGEPPDLDDRRPLDLAGASIQFPLHLRGPCDLAGLNALVRRARAGGTSVVLVSLPRSVSAERLMGPGQSAQIDRKAVGLASDLGVPLVAPRGPWPDDRFVTLGHTNRAGRAQFLAALRGAVAARP